MLGLMESDGLASERVMELIQILQPIYLLDQLQAGHEHLRESEEQTDGMDGSVCPEWTTRQVQRM